MGGRQSGGVVQREKKCQVPADKVCGTADAGASTVDLPGVPTVSALLSLDPTGGPQLGFLRVSLTLASPHSPHRAAAWSRKDLGFPAEASVKLKME